MSLAPPLAMAIKQILVATDFSQRARAAVDLAIEIGKPLGASIELVHAYQIPFSLLPEGTILPLTPETVIAIQTESDTRLTAERDRVAATGLRVRTTSLEGAPADAIVAEAEREAADLIVMGTHGRTGFERLALGSIAEDVLRHAPCPVLVVRQTQEQ